MTEQFIERYTYLGVLLTLLAGGLGMPIPEEVPIVTSAVLARHGIIRWWLALPLCLVAAVTADAVLYWVGRHYRDRIVRWRMTRLVLTPQRVDWLEQAYRRHGAKIVFSARHAMGLRPAAFLTAGAFGIPFWTFIAVDTGAALVSIPLGFGIAYLFTDEIMALVAGLHRIERWLFLALLVLAAAWLAFRARRRIHIG